MSEDDIRMSGRRRFLKIGAAAASTTILPTKVAATKRKGQHQSAPKNTNSRKKRRPVQFELEGGELTYTIVPKQITVDKQTTSLHAIQNTEQLSVRNTKYSGKQAAISTDNIQSGIEALNRAKRNGHIEFEENNGTVLIQYSNMEPNESYSLTSHGCGLTYFTTKDRLLHTKYKVFMDDELTEDVAHETTIGGITSGGLVNLLMAAGLLGGAGAGVGIVIGTGLLIAGEQLRDENEGCGVQVNIKQYLNSPAIRVAKIKPQ